MRRLWQIKPLKCTLFVMRTEWKYETIVEIFFLVIFASLNNKEEENALLLFFLHLVFLLFRAHTQNTVRCRMTFIFWIKRDSRHWSKFFYASNQSDNNENNETGGTKLTKGSSEGKWRMNEKKSEEIMNYSWRRNQTWAIEENSMREKQKKIFYLCSI